jgi:hypothetical protein
MPKVGQLRNLNEKHFVVMRQIGDRIDQLRKQERSLIPTGGRLGIGSAWFDPMIQAEALEEFLRWYRKGYLAPVCAEKATKYTREIIKRWNANPRGVPINGAYELHRDKDCAGPMIQWALMILHALEG